MSIALKDWRDYPPGKEKYQLYLASREWAVKKEAVKQRSGGTCERCRHNPGEQVHHQTYERIYNEALEDLIHTCRPCHEFVSGKSDRDPRLDVPAKLLGQEIHAVYLAGKITCSPWRDQIAPGWSHDREGIANANDLYEGRWKRADDAVPLPDGRRLDLQGPWWRMLDGGEHAGLSGTVGDHCMGHEDLGHGDSKTDRKEVAFLIRTAIMFSDLVFAWIDTEDCYGTLVELGYAFGMRTPIRDNDGRYPVRIVVVATPPDFCWSDHWLATVFAHAHIEAPSPAEAWHALWTDARYRGR